MRPDFSDLTLNTAVKQQAAAEEHQEIWHTPEGIPVKKHFTETDIKDAEHLHFAAGLPPFTRGPYSTMYVDHSPICRIFNCRGIERLLQKKFGGGPKRIVGCF